ncbi:hypothetical protein H0E87_029090, partial [Populus deltoides]
MPAGVAVIPLALRVHNRDHRFYLALVVFVSACPCALILSTPVATFLCTYKGSNSWSSDQREGTILKHWARLRQWLSTKP